MKTIRLFATDIDGVWTDGGMYYDANGNEWKKFNTSDSAGVAFLKLLDIPVVILTGENTPIVQRRADKLGIAECHIGVVHKLEKMQEICTKHNVSLTEVAYIGDDLNDISLLKAAGLSACPVNAPSYVQQIVHWPLPVKGGHGAFRAFVEKYLQENNLLESTVQKWLDERNKLSQ
jgi:3-deoxy-D-glycero-D-galacto-nononate 9-phosphatase